MRLTAEQADILIAAAKAKAKDTGVAVSIAVLDSAGHLKAFLRMAEKLIGNERGRLDPSDMIGRMVEVIPSSTGKFRNIHPKMIEDSLRSHQSEMFQREI